MLQRIKSILDFKGLSITQFADEIGVARPIMSHILTGRNKPSLEVVQKILKAFPDLSVPWVVLGEGLMLKNTEKEQLKPAPEPEKNNLKQEAASKISSEPNPEKSQKEKSETKPVWNFNQSKSEAEKIIILYPDNTFREFEKR